MLAKYKESILLLILFLGILFFAISKTYPKVVAVYTTETNIKNATAQVATLTQQLDGLKKANDAKQMLMSQSPKKIFKVDNPNADMEASFTTMFDDIIDMAKYDGVRIFAVQYNYDPQDDDFIKGGAGKYHVCTIDMELVSDYADLSSFLKDLYKYPYLLNIDKLQLAAYPKNKRILLTTLSMKIYTTNS